MSNYVPARVATAKLGVCLRTLLRWEEAGKIKTIKTPNGQRRYDTSSVTSNNDEKSVILYARVSGNRQKFDLERQASFLQSHFPQGELFTEVGSGLNFKRPKLQAILERVMSGDVRLLVVGHKDRLSRFGFDHFQWLCNKFNCQILVLNQTNLSPEREMVEDILAIVHVFSCRLYGLRKYKQAIRSDDDLQTISSDSNPTTGNIA